MITKEDALKHAKNAFSTSTTYVDANYRKRWDDNLRLNNNKHPIGSKYNSDAYKYKSKGFRPKTRSVTRNAEAAAASAFLSNRDAISVDPLSTKNPEQRASAELREFLLNYRLQHTIPWFLTIVGGMQDAQVNGVVCSKQYWDLEHKETKLESTNEFGEEEEKVERIVTKDEPKVDLHPIENVRIDPAANWTDPVNSSPYVILMLPMFVGDVKAKIKKGEWLEVSDNELSAAKSKSTDTTKQARENDQEDSQGVNHTEALSDFDIVFVHENFMRVNGEEIQYYTLGCEKLLSEPALLGDVYWHNVRPIVIGNCIVEPHRIYPHSPVELGAGLQQEANEIRNSRLDNVRLAMNKRYIVKRGSQTDIKSLVRNVAGSVSMATDPTADVKALEFNDVTGSSFAEQDRINVDYDELLGSFSSGSVQSNRKLNETVGGMAMLRSSSNALTQYVMAVFSETWVEKVLRQLDMLEQHYESDSELIKTAMLELSITERYGIEEVNNDLLLQRATVSVNITNSSTDPILRLDQFISAIKIYSEIAQNPPPGVKMDEVKKEIFAFLGYRDGRRFLDEDGVDPQIQQMQEIIQQLEAQVESKELLAAQKMETEQMKEAAETQRNTEDNETKLLIENNKREMAEGDQGEGDSEENTDVDGIFEILKDLALRMDQIQEEHKEVTGGL